MSPPQVVSDDGTMKRILLLIVIYLAFVSLGLPDSVLGLAWPAMRTSLGQPLEALGIVTFLLTACSAFSGFMSGKILSHFGTGRVTFVSALMTGLSLLGLSLVPSFPFMIALAFPLGLGAGSVDAGLNHFVAEHYSSKHMNWLHACWGVGATLGPMIMGGALIGAGHWPQGYQTIAACQLTLATILLLSLGLWKQQAPSQPDPEKVPDSGQPNTAAWVPVLAASLFVVYAAVELSTGLWAASILIEGRHFQPGLAGLAITLFYGSIMGGRVLIGFVSNKVGNRRLIRLGLVIAIVGIVTLAVPGIPDTLAFVGMVLMGLGCAPIYPSLMHETPRRFDPATARKVIGWQVAAANIGGALMPAAFGLLAAHIGLNAVFPAIGICAILLLVLSQWLDRLTRRPISR